MHALESAGLAEEDQADLHAHCKEYHPEFKFVLTVGVATGKDVDIKGEEPREKTDTIAQTLPEGVARFQIQLTAGDCGDLRAV